MFVRPTMYIGRRGNQIRPVPFHMRTTKAQTTENHGLYGMDCRCSGTVAHLNQHRATNVCISLEQVQHGTLGSVIGQRPVVFWLFQAFHPVGYRRPARLYPLFLSSLHSATSGSLEPAGRTPPAEARSKATQPGAPPPRRGRRPQVPAPGQKSQLLPLT